MKTLFAQYRVNKIDLNVCRIDVVDPSARSRYTEIGTNFTNNIESIFCDIDRGNIMPALTKALCHTYRYNDKIMGFNREVSDTGLKTPWLLGFVTLYDGRVYSIWVVRKCELRVHRREPRSNEGEQLFVSQVIIGDTGIKKYLMFSESIRADSIVPEFPKIDVMGKLMTDDTSTYTKFRSELRRWNNATYDKYKLSVTETDRRVLSFIFFPDNL